MDANDWSVGDAKLVGSSVISNIVLQKRSKKVPLFGENWKTTTVV